MTREERTAHIYTTWMELKKDKTITSDTLTRGHMDDIADKMLCIMESVFSNHKEVQQLLRLLRDTQC